jgi:hypothetical protein
LSRRCFFEWNLSVPEFVLLLPRLSPREMASRMEPIALPLCLLPQSAPYLPSDSVPFAIFDVSALQGAKHSITVAKKLLPASSSLISSLLVRLKSNREPVVLVTLKPCSGFLCVCVFPDRFAKVERARKNKRLRLPRSRVGCLFLDCRLVSQQAEQGPGGWKNARCPWPCRVFLR